MSLFLHLITDAGKCIGIDYVEGKNRQRHGRSTRRVNKTQKKVISLAKGKKQRECARDLNDPNQQNEIFRIAKQMVKER